VLLRELQARRELKEYFVRALSDTVAILKADDPDRLLRELRKAGYQPISDDAPAARAHALRARPAPPKVPAAPEKPSVQAAPPVSGPDWTRIAQDDDKSWSAGPEAAVNSGARVPADAMRGSTRIKVLINIAIQRRQRLEIAYQELSSAPGEEPNVA